MHALRVATGQAEDPEHPLSLNRIDQKGDRSTMLPHDENIIGTNARARSRLALSTGLKPEGVTQTDGELRGLGLERPSLNQRALPYADEQLVAGFVFPAEAGRK